MHFKMIALIDYKAGNLNSVVKAFERVGARIFIAQDFKDLRKADKLLLPGVGSFKKAMENLKKLGFIEALQEQVLVQKKQFIRFSQIFKILSNENSSSHSFKSLNNGI